MIKSGDFINFTDDLRTLIKTNCQNPNGSYKSKDELIKDIEVLDALAHLIFDVERILKGNR